MSKGLEARMDKAAPILVVAAEVVRSGLMVHFSDGTSSLFSHDFLYHARKNQANTLIAEQGFTIPGSIVEALSDEE